MKEHGAPSNDDLLTATAPEIEARYGPPGTHTFLHVYFAVHGGSGAEAAAGASELPKTAAREERARHVDTAAAAKAARQVCEQQADAAQAEHERLAAAVEQAKQSAASLRRQQAAMAAALAQAQTTLAAWEAANDATAGPKNVQRVAVAEAERVLVGDGAIASADGTVERARPEH